MLINTTNAQNKCCLKYAKLGQVFAFKKVSLLTRGKQRLVVMLES
jgi:hypothetical protein